MNTRRLGFLAVAILCASWISAQTTPTIGGKTGILLVHYGTQNDHSRAITIDKLNDKVKKDFAQCTVVEAYAAPSVIKSLNNRGTTKMSIADALDSLKTAGCERLAVQSTMLLDGVMTDLLKREVDRAKKNFRSVSVARPLLYSVDDCRHLVEMIDRNLHSDKSLKTDGAQIVLVGHGSDSPANAMYAQIDYLLKDEGHATWHVGTIEGYPTLDAVKRQLKKAKSKRVVLIPLLYIAGNHQKEDINGIWKEQLQKEGYTVCVLNRGLGEMQEIQDMITSNIAKMIE